MARWHHSHIDLVRPVPGGWQIRFLEDGMYWFVRYMILTAREAPEPKVGDAVSWTNGDIGCRYAMSAFALGEKLLWQDR